MVDTLVLIGTSALASTAQANDVKVLFSFALPPYVIRDSGKPEGYAYVISKESVQRE